MTSVIIKMAARVLLFFIITYGIYIIVNGHLTPGGGFQGGVVIATGFILVFIGYGKSTEEVFKETKMSLAENIGSITYVSIGFAGLLAGSNFLQNNGVFGLGTVGDLFSAGFMLPLNSAIGTKVAAGIGTIALLFLALIWADEKVDEKK